MFVELRELLHSGAIRKHQLGAKDLLTPTSLYPIPGFLSPGNIKRAAQSIQAARKFNISFSLRLLLNSQNMLLTFLTVPHQMLQGSLLQGYLHWHRR